MYESVQWWQQLLGTVLTALSIGGVVGLFIAVRRGRRGDPTARSLALTSLGSLVLAGIGTLTVGSYVKAKRDVPPRPSVNDKHGFVSSTPPAVSIEAPLGWRASHDPKEGVAVVQTGTQGEPTWSALSIQSTRLDDPMDMRKMTKAVLAAIRQNQQVELRSPPIDARIAGLPAMQFSKRFPGTDLLVCTWQVQRGRAYAAIVNCATLTGQDACTACDVALRTLEWVRPSGVPAADL